MPQPTTDKDSQQQEWLYGIHSVQTLIKTAPERIIRLLIAKKSSVRLEKLLKQAEKHNINIGMAVALSDGNLIVPVIKNADRLNLVGITKAVNDLAKRARNNKLTADDLNSHIEKIKYADILIDLRIKLRWFDTSKRRARCFKK